MAAKNLKNVSEEDLKAELAERERQKKAGAKPKPIANPDYKRLVQCLEAGMEEIAERGYSKDFDHYVFEEAMKAVYGPKVFDWYNKAWNGC